MRAFQTCSQIPLPCIFYSRLINFPIVQILQVPEVVPQVVHRLYVVLLLCCKNVVEELQLHGKRKKMAAQMQALFSLCICVRVCFSMGVMNIKHRAELHLKPLASS